MGTYKNSAITKEKLIASATELFYDLGYQNTSIEKIAGACGLTKGIVTYYFGFKSNLASIAEENVEKTVLDEVLKKLESIYGLNDSNYILAVYTAARIMFRTFKSDNKAFYFYKDSYMNNIEHQGMHEKTVWPMILKKSNLELEDKYYNFDVMAAVSAGATASFTIRYISGKIDIPYDIAENYRVAIPLRCMNMIEEKINYFINKSREAADLLNILIRPNYHYHDIHHKKRS